MSLIKPNKTMKIFRTILDFSIEKSTLSGSEGPHSQIRREFDWLCGVGHIPQGYVDTQILPAEGMHKIVQSKILDTLQNRQNPHRILSCNPFGANFYCKFGIIVISCLILTGLSEFGICQKEENLWHLP